MKKLLNINLLIAFAIIFASCATNNNVVNNRLISKRKFNKGFHINTKGKMKSSQVNEEESIAYDDSKNKGQDDKKVAKRNQTNAEATKTNDESASSSAQTTQNEQEYIVEETSRNSHTTTGTSDGLNEWELMPEDQDSRRSSDDATVQKTERSTKSSESKRASDADVRTILLVILALFIAPLAVFIFEGASNRFWLTLVLWLIGIGVGFFLFGGSIAWACGLIAAIYAILIVLGVI